MPTNDKLTSREIRKPRNLSRYYLQNDLKAEYQRRTSPNSDALRLASIDFSIADDAELLKEIGLVRALALQAAESSAGMDDVDYWDRWQFDTIISPDLVVRLCELVTKRGG